MYKVILVDDDELVHVGLESLAHFRQHGFEIVDSLTNAKLALESIRRHQPDVVITDMYMPEMNGIQLIKEGKKICPNAVFVVLSCHNDIEYIKEALQAGAYDYMLKSVIVDSVNAEKLLEKVASACSMRNQISATGKGLASDKSTLLSYLTGKNLPLDVIRRCLYMYGFDISGPSFFLSCLQIDNYDSLRRMVSDEQNLLLKIEQYIDNYLAEYGVGISLYHESGCYYLLQQITSDSPLISASDKLLSVCERLRICIRNDFLHTCCIHVSTGCRLSMLPTAAQQMQLSVQSATGILFDSIINTEDDKVSYQMEEPADNAVDPIDTVIRYIEKNYAASISLDELSSVTNFSKFHLCRKFKDVTGMGITNYILNYRINKAKEFLLAPNSGKIFEIAKSVGFNDTSYFNRTFKKHTSYTPNEYQRLNKATPSCDEHLEEEL